MLRHCARRLYIPLAVLIGPLQAIAAPYNGPIIDVHIHADVPRTQRANPVTGSDPAVSVEALLAAVLRECEEHNIVKAVVHGSEESVRLWHKADPDRFIIAPMILRRSRLPEISAAALREQIRSGTAGAIGEITAQYSGLAPDDAVLTEYWALAEEMDVLVMLHTGTSFPNTAQVSPNFRLRLGNPLLAEEVLVRHPRLRIVMAHGGLPFEQEIFAVMSQYPQVYIDISTINWMGGDSGRLRFHEFLRKLLERGLGKRVLFGSDAMAWPDAIGLAIDSVDSAPFLSAQQKSDIFYGNASRILKIEAHD